MAKGKNPAPGVDQARDAGSPDQVRGATPTLPHRAEEGVAAPLSLIERLQVAHKAAEKARDHHGAAALNGVLLALGEAKAKARTALSAVDETLDGRVLREAAAMVPEVRQILEAVARL